jgi:hypothetical protein
MTHVVHLQKLNIIHVKHLEAGLLSVNTEITSYSSITLLYYVLKFVLEV